MESKPTAMANPDMARGGYLSPMRRAQRMQIYLVSGAWKKSSEGDIQASTCAGKYFDAFNAGVGLLEALPLAEHECSGQITLRIALAVWVDGACAPTDT